MKNIKIAIDGHSSCGKSTMAKALAKHFGFVFVDTGAMYRTVTLFAMRNQMIDKDKNINTDSLKAQIKNLKINFKKMDDSTLHTCLNGEDVEKEIREMAVTSNVSAISALKFVREEMVNQQRAIASETSVVMDGRDIGTVVFPNAELKIFVTARPEVRAQRRFDEMRAKGGSKVTFNEVLESLKQRDLLDSTRAESPLKKADDAVLLDNSDMTRDEQFNLAVEMVEKVIR